MFAAAPRAVLAALLLVLLAAPLAAQQSPEKELEALKAADGFDVSLFASEPLITNPSAIDVDTQGRVWVAEIQWYRSKAKKATGYEHKMKVLSLVDRSTGAQRSFVLDFISAKAIGEIVVENLSREAILMTDEARHYVKIGAGFAGHGHTHHAAGEYVSRLNPLVHTNTVEGYFSIFKRGMKGVYQHCNEQHLHRYLSEFEFRYNNREKFEISDTIRAEIALRGVVGKRLTYETASRAN